LISRTSLNVVAALLVLVVGVAQALSPGANIINCSQTDYFQVGETPAGQNNITISIVNDKCNYYGLSGTVYTNVTQNQTAGMGITFANFSQMLNVAGLGDNINLTVEYWTGSAWQLLQNNAASTPINDATFSWTNGETKQFRSNYSVASTFQSTAKFNVSNTINFTPIISNGYELEVSDSVSPLSAINYTGAAGTSGPIIVVYSAPSTAPTFWHTNGTNELASAFGPETAGFNISYPGSCEAKFASAPAEFNVTNKTAIAGNLYCFPVTSGETTFGYTMVKVANVTLPSGAPGSGLVGIKTKMVANKTYLVAENDPVFDSARHNVTINLTNTSVAPVENQNVSIYNSTGALVASNTTNSTGFATLFDVPSENYTIIAHNGSMAAYNVTSAGNVLNGTGYNPMINLTGYDTDTPIVNITGLANATTTRFEALVPVNISVSDLASGFANAMNCTITVGGASTSQIARSGYWCNGSITVPNTADGNQTLNVSISDAAGHLGYDASFVLLVDNTHYTATTPTINVTHNQSYVAITNDTQNLTVFLPANGNATYLNVSAFKLSNGTATINVSVVANATSSFLSGTTAVWFPVNNTITNSTAWDGNIKLPIIQATTTQTVTADSGYTSTTYAVIDMGINGGTLTFSKGVRILIPGMAGKLAAYVDGAGTHKITQTCDGDTQSIGDALGSAGYNECKRDVGSDLVIWTKHFTTFVAYNQTATTTTTPSGYTYVTTTPTPSPVPSPTPSPVPSPSVAPLQATPIVQSSPTPSLEPSVTPSEIAQVQTTGSNAPSPTPSAAPLTAQQKGVDLLWIISGVVVLGAGVAAFLLLRKPPQAPILPPEPPAA